MTTSDILKGAGHFVQGLFQIGRKHLLVDALQHIIIEPEGVHQGIIRALYRGLHAIARHFIDGGIDLRPDLGVVEKLPHCGVELFGIGTRATGR